MTPYALTKKIFTPAEYELYRRARALVDVAPSNDWHNELIRCHELAWAIGDVLGLEVQNGHCGSIQHSWLWTHKPTTNELRSWERGWYHEGRPKILDVYVPGAIPPVQLLDPWALRMGKGSRYDFRDPGVAIDHGIVDMLVVLWRGKGLV